MPRYVELTCEVCNKTFQKEYKKRTHKTCSKDCSYRLRQKSRKEIHGSLKKVCDCCNQVFNDTSKKKLVTTCKGCVYKKMVETRHTNESYSRTEEQNKKLSETLKEKYKNGWNEKVNTPRLRAKNSRRMKKMWSSGKMQQMTKQTCLKKYGVEHWMQTDEAIHKVKNSGSFYRDDLGRAFRSSWEANYARILNYENIKWEFEPRFFELSNGERYLPDFLIEGKKFIEIKGFWYGNSREKVEMFKIEYSEFEFEIIDGSEYNKLESKYKHLIKEWE